MRPQPRADRAHPFPLGNQDQPCLPGEAVASLHCPEDPGASLGAWPCPALSTGMGSGDRATRQGPDCPGDTWALGAATDSPSPPQAEGGPRRGCFKTRPCKAQGEGERARGAGARCSGQGPGRLGASGAAACSPCLQPPASHRKLLRNHVSSKFQCGKYSSIQYVVLAESYEF